ncbi:NAD(+) diphosphatase [Maritimibacter dapengensis]|uniref:NAD(+) diphosphatase n=1 Tax=Maritimibacter dapengensis TaxID=2836868 RepID=A0ABS6SZH0_9RHOB|nr:NAD(+) diphosphatase [Maritimibacter dapengensis]MBV7377522.1 NAD(+) diphosphatase [Maritimibacter dapengensis]
MDLSQLAFRTGGLERAAHLRTEWETLWPKARILPMWRGRPLVAGTTGKGGTLRLCLVASDHPIAALQTAEPLFLGQDATSPLFAADISGWSPEDTARDGGPGDPGEAQPAPAIGDLPDDARFPDMRGILMGLTAYEGELAATARGIIEWHRSHGFCASCGAKSNVSQAGWRRDCPACGKMHFPRTDPVVIMLITHGNSILMGRSPGWPDRMYSLLAGFMEPGETIESAVAREVAEEVGLQIGPVRIFASQPWPFPASLMIGCAAEALSRDMHVDPVEIEDALWITREDLADVFADTHPVIRRPRSGAIAQVLMKNWLAGTLP